MKKLIGASLIALSLFACTQPSFAGNFKKNSSAKASTRATTQSNSGVQGLALGAFSTDCSFFETPGTASGAFQNIVVNNHNQVTVNLKASGGGAAYSDLENPQSAFTVIKTPITFNLVKGNGNFLGIEVAFIPHNGTDEQFIDFVTPDSKLPKFFDGLASLVSNGNGEFTVPLGNGTTGIPQGAQLTNFFFVEFGNPNNCDNKNSNVNNLRINNRSIPLDASAAAAFCDFGCGEGAGAAAR